MSEFEVYTLAGVGGTSQLVTKTTNFPGGVAWSPGGSRLVISEWTEKGAQLFEIPVLGGSPRPLLGAPNAVWPALSAKGDKLAYSAISNNVNIWRKDLLHKGLPAVKVISSTWLQTGAQYSPDAKHIAFASNRAGPWNTWMQDPDGSKLVQITNLADGADVPNWSPDGKKIAFDLYRLGRHEIYIVDIDERIPRKLTTNVPRISSPTWSHDGKWIYFRSYETIGHKIYRCPAAGGDALPLLSLPDGGNSIEAFDGNSLYFVRRNGNTRLGILPVNGASTGSDTGSDVQGMPAIRDFLLWTLVPGGVYFVPHDDPRSLHYYDFSTKKTHRISTIDKDFDSGLSISPDGHYALFSQLDEENSNIMLVDHFN